jgi:membrane AbrB-like protein
VGIAGALLAQVLRFPIPWLLGSLIACAVAIRAGLPVKSMPGTLERWMRVAIGVSLGPSVAESVQHSSSDLPFAIATAIIITTVTVLAGMPWFERRAHLPRPAAFMSALPGGLSMLLALAGDTGNRAEVLLVHAVRVLIVVVSISLLARMLGVPPVPDPLMASLDWHNDTSPWVLAGMIIACFVLAERLNIAGGHVIVPMIITTIIATFSDISIAPPTLLKTVALLVFGMVIACEVAKGPRDRYVQLFGASSMFTIAIMALGALFAMILTRLIDQHFLVLFLALAPGGIAEVSLVALALGLDAGMVALVHSCRFIYIIMAGPVGMQMLLKRESLMPKK